jgi:AraC family transcriptional regulator
LRLHDLARLAHFSPFHFHRIFSSLVGQPLHGFIRRLRLERAVAMMQHGPKKSLTEIAFIMGFASSSDFSRAFKQHYGFSPRGFSRQRLLQESKIRQDLLPHRDYHLVQLPATSNPDRFRVRLVDQPKQRIAYVRVINTTSMEKVMAAYHRLMQWGQAQGLVPGAQLYGISRDDPNITPLSQYQIDWCLAVPDDVKPRGTVSDGVIPANRCAVVYSNGDLSKEYRAWMYLYYTWLPRSGYEPADAPNMEMYRTYPNSGSTTYDLDCCLPLQPLRKR